MKSGQYTIIRFQKRRNFILWPNTTDGHYAQKFLTPVVKNRNYAYLSIILMHKPIFLKLMILFFLSSYPQKITATHGFAHPMLITFLTEKNLWVYWVMPS